MAQTDTCQLIMAQLLRFIRESKETLHPEILKEILLAVQAIESRVQVKLLEIRIEDLILDKHLRQKREINDSDSGVS